MSLFAKLFGLAGHSQAQSKPSLSVTIHAEGDVQKYFALLELIQGYQAKRQYDQMLDACARSLPLLGPLVRHWNREFGKFEVCSIPAIEVGCRYWAALNDIVALKLVTQTIQQIPELREGWAGIVNVAYEDAALATAIQDWVMKNPGVLQNKIGKHLNVPGKDTASLINTLANLGRIVRVQSGKTYELHNVAQ